MIMFKKKTQKATFEKDSVFLHHTGNLFGIGCSVFSEKAIERIDSLKQRKDKKGYIILFPEIEWLEKYRIQISPKIKRLMQQYLPGNLTIVLDDPENNFPLVSDQKKIAIRIPSSKFLRDFIKKINVPIISTSVNFSGEEALNDLEQIRAEKGKWFDLEVLSGKKRYDYSKPSTIINYQENKLICLREGSIKFGQIKKSFESPLILFVCTGNICRSPMAEYYLKKLIAAKKMKYRAASAGFLNSDVRISPHSFEVLKNDDIDASQHISTHITKELISDSWLILTMTEQHKRSILEFVPNSFNKVFTLSEYCGKKFCLLSCDIDDPIGMEIYFYRETYKMIKERIEILVEKLEDYS